MNSITGRISSDKLSFQEIDKYNPLRSVKKGPDKVLVQINYLDMELRTVAYYLKNKGDKEWNG